MHRPRMEIADRYMQHRDRYRGFEPTDREYRVKYEIFQLGVLLLELDKGYYFGGDEALMDEWRNKSGEDLKAALLELAKIPGRLGAKFQKPIVACLTGFEDLDPMGSEMALCHPRVSGGFQSLVMDPLGLKLKDNTT